jgi:hypothetical protein
MENGKWEMANNKESIFHLPFAIAHFPSERETGNGKPESILHPAS